MSSSLFNSENSHRQLPIASCYHDSSVTSIKPECLQNLRFPCDSSSKKKTHLLAYMSEFIDDQEEIKIQELQEFCSFDRIKRIIEKKREAEGDGTLSGPQIDNDKGPVSQKMMGVLQIQAKMKKMSDNLTKCGSRPLTATLPNSLKTSKKSMTKTACNSTGFQHLRQFHNKTSKDIKKFQSINSHISQHTGTQDKNNRPSHHLLGRHTIKKKFQEAGYEQYMKWQKKKQSDKQDEIKLFIEQEIKSKVQNMLEERDIKYNQLVKQNKAKERKILQKQLQIENLKSKQETLLTTVDQLQVFRDLYCEEQTLKKKDENKFYEAFYKEFNSTFPKETIPSLKKYVQNLIHKCLDKFNDIESKNYDKWNEEKKEYHDKIDRLQGTIGKLRNTQNELRNTLKSIKRQQSESNMEIETLLKDKEELGKLQQKVLSIYNEWYAHRTEHEKQIMHNLGYMKGSYEYNQMLDFIAAYRQKLSTDHKVHEYLIKVLRGIERIRKIMFPRNDLQESDQPKKDPLLFMEKLEKYIKAKVYQARFRKGQHKQTRMSELMEEEFLTVQESKSEEEQE